VLRKLDPIHHGEVSLALGTFVMCKTENVLCEAGLPTLTVMRDDEDRNKNIDEQKPPYHTTNDKPEHAMKPGSPKPFYIRAAELLGQMDIDGTLLKVPRLNLLQPNIN
jgi:hypothetical protein